MTYTSPLITWLQYENYDPSSTNQSALLDQSDGPIALVGETIPEGWACKRLNLRLLSACLSIERGLT